jgi:hypothetical protein
MVPTANPQEYTVTNFRAGDFTDRNGNKWCNLALEGVSEPLSIVVKDPSQYQVGMKLYGHIELKQSQQGRTYNRFYRDQKPQWNSTDTKDTTFKSGYTRDDDAIRAQWAIGQAVQLSVHGTGMEFKDIEASARTFYSMVDRVKGSKGGSQGPREVYSSPTATQAPQSPVEAAYPIDAHPDPLDSVFGSGQYEPAPEDLIPPEYR